MSASLDHRSLAKAPVSPVRLGFLQRKCSCGDRSPIGIDAHEQEADRIADQVLTRPVSSGMSAADAGIQRLASPGTSRDALPTGVQASMAGGGAPLEPGLRHDMEQRIG